MKGIFVGDSNHACIRSLTQTFSCAIHLQRKDGSNISVSADVDSLSDVTGITRSAYESHFADTELCPVEGDIENFDHTPISGILGHFMTIVTFSGRSARLPIYVFPESYGNIIGRDGIYALEMVLDGAEKQVRTAKLATKYQNMLSKFPNLTKDGIGCFPDYEHTIVLIEGSAPVKSFSREIPVYRKEKALAEIRSMEKDGILYRVDRSEWIHPMVIVDKPGGGVRVTTNLISLNRHVAPFRFPLPIIREMMLKLRGTKCMSKLDIKSLFQREIGRRIATSYHDRHTTRLIRVRKATNGINRFRCRVPVRCFPSTVGSASQ